MPPPTALDNRDELSELYEQASIAEVAAQLGTSTTSVQRALVRHGIPRRGRGEVARLTIRHPELRNRVELAARYARSSITDIAAAAGVSITTVRRALVLHGIELHQSAHIPRADRPPLLDDPEWLAERYEQAWSIREIAEELGTNEQRVNRALRRHGIAVRSARGGEHPALTDRAWLAERLDEVGTDVIAAELGVSRVGVQRALERFGIASPHRFESQRLAKPRDARLHEVWRREETIKGVARELGVSHNTAAIWLASVGIFVKTIPLIGRREMECHIADGLTIAQICRVHRVTGRTVIVELHRHGLFEAHRRRHLVECQGAD